MSSTLFTYLWQANLYLVLFYMLYILLLRQETFFQWNRVYLLGSVLVALSIPLLPSPEFAAESVIIQEVSNYNPFPERNIVASQITFNAKQATNPALVPESKPLISFIGYLWVLYGIVSILILFRLVVSLTYLGYLFFKFPRIKRQGYWIVHTSNNTSFSFLNILFLGRCAHLSTENQSKIILHELVHIKQWHSLDILGLALLTGAFWWNPVVWLYLKSLRKIHEYLADAQVLRSGTKVQEYMQLLIREMMGYQQYYATLQFARPSTLRNRYVMMQRLAQSPKRYHRLKLLLVLPLLAMTLVLQWACNRAGFEEVNSLTTNTQAFPEGYRLLNTFFNKKPNTTQQEYTLILANDNKYLLRVSPVEFRGKVVLLDKNYQSLHTFKFPEHSANFFHNDAYFQVAAAEAYNLQIIPEKPLKETLQIDVAYLVDKKWEEFKAQREENSRRFPQPKINIKPVLKLVEKDLLFETQMSENLKYHFSIFDYTSEKNIPYSVSISILDAQNKQIHQFELSHTQQYVKDFHFQKTGNYTFKVKTTHTSPKLELIMYEDNYPEVSIQEKN